MQPIIFTSILLKNGFLEDFDYEHAIQNVKDKLYPAWKNSLFLWPAAFWINFHFVPCHF